jgi:hypothetical protein
MQGHGVSTTSPVKHKLCLEYSGKSNSVIFFLENLKVILFKAIHINRNMKTEEKKQATKQNLDTTKSNS